MAHKGLQYLEYKKEIEESENKLTGIKQELEQAKGKLKHEKKAGKIKTLE
jgi:hypothetical protein